MVAAMVPLGVSAEAAFAGAVNLRLFLLGVTVLLGLSAFCCCRCGGRPCARGGDLLFVLI